MEERSHSMPDQLEIDLGLEPSAESKRVTIENDIREAEIEPYMQHTNSSVAQPSPP